MTENCDIKNPLVRDGSSQTGRLLKALSPDYARVDERSQADLLAFAVSYAGTLQYYDRSNSPAGDWKAFIEKDISTVVALIARKELTLFREAAGHAMAVIGRTASTEAELKRALKSLFDLSFTLASQIDDWHEKGVEGLQLKETLHRIISSELAAHLKGFIACYKCADGAALIAEAPLAGMELPEEIEASAGLLEKRFHPIWMAPNASPPASWQDYVNAISEECGPFGKTSDSDSQRIRLAGPTVISFFEAFYKAQAEVIHQSPAFLEETITRWPDHEPHMALLLAFIRLFRRAQDDMNGITGRHLDFYYKKVLRFVEKNALPHKVHLLFELSRQVKSHLLKKGTELKGGKDATGVNVFYLTDRDIVINGAKVSQLKTLFVDRSDSCRIYAAAMANSSDGQGADFEVAEPRWKSFGESQLDGESGKYLDKENRTMAFAEVGFAIASPALLLTEGMRTILLTFTVDDLGDIELNDFNDIFEASLSGEKEWIVMALTATALVKATGKVTLQCIATPDQPSAAPFDAKVHEGRYGTSFPVLKIILKNRPQSSPPYGYQLLKDLQLAGVDLSITVGGAKNVIIQGDTGLIDGTKPFLPFGPLPSIGSGFYVGSAEIFQKRLTSLSIDLEWKDVPAANLGTYYSAYGAGVTNAGFKGQLSILYNHGWQKLGSQNSLFKADAGQKQTWSYNSEFNTLPGYEQTPLPGPLTAYGHGTERGFIRLELTSPAIALGHRKFRELYATRVIQYANSPTAANEALIPKEPYTPQLAAITLGYSAADSIDFVAPASDGDRGAAFYHIYPFGEVRAQQPPAWIPPFETTFADSVVENEGELYIGVSGLEPRQNLSLLFQLAEGSADPELNKEKVYWSYLSDNRWIAFETGEILFDSTSGLITSGIIEFDVPKKASMNNTLLPEKMHWIRATIEKNAGALCDMLDIRAQAVQASFIDSKNDPNYLARSLPADSISKLKVKESAIKSINQPFASWGGKMKEEESRFYARVSERLRHKNRSITLWDYEKMVLEKFPAIYKVKCINHSTYHYEKGDLKIDASEFAPGYVTLIVIPDLTNKNAVDPLEPRVSLAMLEEVRTWLCRHISPFAAETLRVINPLYEKVQVEFGVQFRAGFDRGFYEKKLNEDLKAYLSPWIAGAGREIVFGGKIHKSVILNFVEELAYVDFVTHFKMNQLIPHSSGLTFRADTDEAVPSTARSILVSHKAHVISEAVCP